MVPNGATFPEARYAYSGLGGLGLGRLDEIIGRAEIDVSIRILKGQYISCEQQKSPAVFVLEGMNDE